MCLIQKKKTETIVRIPNREIWEYILGTLKEYYITNYELESGLLKYINYSNFKSGLKNSKLGLKVKDTFCQIISNISREVMLEYNIITVYILFLVISSYINLG